MVHYLKAVSASVDTTARDREVRDTVTAIIEDVAKRGDAAVHELSLRFDNFDRDDFRLSASEIENCLANIRVRRNVPYVEAATRRPA
jgi:sulfopropanediol 3-dehydrogenase